MKKIVKCMTVIMFSLLLSACASSPITGERVSTLNPGDDINKVISVVGKPDGFETLKNDVVVYKYINRYISGWDNKTTDYYLFFRDGKLIAVKNGHVNDNGAKLQETLNSLSQQADRQNQRNHESRMKMMDSINKNTPQKVIICKQGDLMCY
jgi:hypothetical protein